MLFTRSSGIEDDTSVPVALVSNPAANRMGMDGEPASVRMANDDLLAAAGQLKGGVPAGNGDCG